MKMYQVDAFTTALFKGNPAAVIVQDAWLDDHLMQNIALENNLSETTFVKVLDAENYEIRWFTPTKEVDFCGHATLASSFLGIFTVRQDENGKIRMNFPIRQPELITDYPEALRQALTKPFKNVYLNT